MCTFQDLLFGARLDAARVASVPVEVFFALLAGHLDFVSVDHDDIVAHVHVRGERRFVLATQTHGDDRGKTAQNNALGVDQDPFLVDVCRCCRKGFHGRIVLFDVKDRPSGAARIRWMGFSEARLWRQYM